jgi:hypothetical protein
MPQQKPKDLTHVTATVDVTVCQRRETNTTYNVTIPAEALETEEKAKREIAYAVERIRWGAPENCHVKSFKIAPPLRFDRYSPKKPSRSAKAYRHAIETQGHNSFTLDFDHTMPFANSADYLKTTYPNLFPIQPDFDCGIRVEDENHAIYEIRLNPQQAGRGYKRTLKLKASDLLFSAGAQHYYAKLSEDYCSKIWHCIDNQLWHTDSTFTKKPEVGENCHEPSHLHGHSEHYKDRSQRWEIEVMRPMTRKDVKEHKRYGGYTYKVGSPTRGFYTPEDAWRAAIAFFKTHFAPGWRLIGEFDYQDTSPKTALSEEERNLCILSNSK